MSKGTSSNPKAESPIELPLKASRKLGLVLKTGVRFSQQILISPRQGL